MDKYTAAEQAYKNGYENGYADAIKEFADRLKEIYNTLQYDRPHAHTLIDKLFCNINDIAEEMVGDGSV